MSHDERTEPPENEARIRELLRVIRSAQDELQQLAGGHVDAIATDDGSWHFLGEMRQQLLKSQQVQLILQSIGEGIQGLDAQGRVLFENPAAASMLARPESELLGRRAHPLMHHHHADGSPYAEEDCPINKTLTDGLVRRVESDVFFRGDGSSFPVEYVCAPMLALSGAITGAVVSFRDVTERREAERALSERTALLANKQRELRASEERFRRTFLDAAVGIAVTTDDGVVLEANAAYHRMLECDEGQLQGRTIESFVHPDDAASHEKLMQELSSSARDSFVVEERFCTAGGRTLWHRVSVSLQRDLEGKVQIIFVAEDVTGQRTAMEQVQRTQGLLRMASRVGRLGGWSVELPDYTTTWSDEVCAIHEVPPDYRPKVENGIAFYAPECREAISAAFQACVTHGTPYELELEIITAKGRRVWVHTIGEAVRDERGVIVRVEGAFQDISQRKHAEHSLLRSELRFRQLADAMPHIVWTATADGVVDYCNRTLSQYTGLAEELSPTERCLRAVHPDQVQLLLTAFKRALASGRALSIELQLYWAEESCYRWHLVRASPVTDDDACVVKWYGTAIEIHETKRVQQEAVRLASELDATLQSISDGFFTLDAELRLKYLNEEAARILGKSADALHGVALATAVPPALSAQLESELEQARTRGQPAEFEVFYEARNAWFSVRGYPSAQGFSVYLRDVTEVRAAREAVRESEQRFQLLSKATNDAIWDWDLTTDRLWRNEGFEALFGRRRAEVEPTILSWRDRIHPDERGKVVAGIQRAIEEGQTQWSDEYRFIRSDGSYAYVLDRGHLIRDTEGKAVHMIGGMTDLSEHKQTEERLAEQAELLDKAQDAILVRDLEGRIVYWNRGAERLYGWSREQALSRNVREMQFSGMSEGFERANQAVVERGEWSGQIEQKCKDGSSVLVEGRWTLVRGRNGEPRSILAINTDITERRRLEQQIFRVQRLESIGTLAGGIAHDLNNVLSPILFSVEMLRLDQTNENRLHDLAVIEACARRGASMVKQVLSFARGVEGKHLPLDLGLLVCETQSVIADAFPRNVELKVEVAPGLWHVSGDATQISQVLMNLAVNARDALPNGGMITIAIENVVVDEVYAEMNPNSRAGSYVLIRVEDTGIGMSASVLERVFEPFFTTKEPGSGTGLGLSTTHAIVRSHGGFINLHSEPGHGTKIKVYLPAIPSEHAAERIALAQTELPRGSGETVLVVDDEEAIRTMVHRSLEHFGYRVIEASNGAEAVAVYADHQTEVAVVLMDMAMPIMDGPAAIVALRSIHPGVRIVASSGLETNGRTATVLDAGVRHFVGKPYTAETLLHTVRRALTE